MRLPTTANLLRLIAILLFPVLTLSLAARAEHGEPARIDAPANDLATDPALR